MKILIFICFALPIFLTSCATQRSYPYPEEPEILLANTQEEAPVIETVAEVPGPVPFAILYSALDIGAAIYEPADGTYLGAWIGPYMTKSEFEDRVGTKHAVFAMEMEVGADFPTTWILQSIAAQTAPLIVLRLPDNYGEEFPLAQLASFAQELGNFNLPSFIVFNPVGPGADITPEDYRLLFRYARVIFRNYAPMAAFVWHGYDNLVTEDSPFYPGHDVVDWVSLEVLAPQTAEGFIVDVAEYLSPFYINFQRYKPIILLPLGVGHFSRRDYVYRVPQAAVEISRVFNVLRDSFPRVRMIVYGNHGVTTPYRDDFGLTREESLITAYRDAVAHNHFINRLAPGSADRIAWMRSPLHGYYYEGQIFIDREVIVSSNNRALPTTEINGRDYINVDFINWMKIATDHTRRVIYMHPGE